MKIEGFILQKEELNNAVILCYKDYKKAKNIYDKLSEEKYTQKDMFTRVKLSFIWNPAEEYSCRVVVEFINRNKDIYIDPPKFSFKGMDLDEFQERTFLSSIDLEDCKIQYSGEVPKID